MLGMVILVLTEVRTGIINRLVIIEITAIVIVAKILVFPDHSRCTSDELAGSHARGTSWLWKDLADSGGAAFYLAMLTAPSEFLQILPTPRLNPQYNRAKKETNS